MRELLGKLFTILVLAIVTFGALRPLNRILVPVGGALGAGVGGPAVDDDEDEEQEDKIEVQEGESLEEIKVTNLKNYHYLQIC